MDGQAASTWWVAQEKTSNIEVKYFRLPMTPDIYYPSQNKNYELNSYATFRQFHSCYSHRAKHYFPFRLIPSLYHAPMSLLLTLADNAQLIGLFDSE
jgi:hypothetical protein